MTGFALEYRWGPSANQFTSLLRSSAFVPTVGAWYTVVLSVKQTTVSASLYAGAPTNPRAVSAAMFGGVAPVATLTTSDSCIGDGGVGMWVNGAATIDSFIVRGSCDAADSCGSVYDGGACHYGCSVGFYPTELPASAGGREHMCRTLTVAHSAQLCPRARHFLFRSDHRRQRRWCRLFR